MTNFKHAEIPASTVRRCQDCAKDIKGVWLPSLCLDCWDKLSDWERKAIAQAMRVEVPSL